MGRHETHNNHRCCDGYRWPRSLWIVRRAGCFPNPRPDCRSNRHADTHRNARANADRDIDPNALTFG